jgi:hypothetical protein
MDFYQVLVVLNNIFIFAAEEKLPCFAIVFQGAYTYFSTRVYFLSDVIENSI